RRANDRSRSQAATLPWVPPSTGPIRGPLCWTARRGPTSDSRAMKVPHAYWPIEFGSGGAFPPVRKRARAVRACRIRASRAFALEDVYRTYADFPKGRAALVDGLRRIRTALR